MTLTAVPIGPVFSPWSAAPLILMIKSACSRTLKENVYMAKLAVLISAPNT